MSTTIGFETTREFLRYFARCLSYAGFQRSDTVMVHSSLSAFGDVPGGASTIIFGLSEFFSSEGTLLMPCLSYETVTTSNPAFDVRNTPSNVGVIAESFRSHGGVLRSVHPTHSVCALGRNQQNILAGHAQDRSPCGDNSPFRKITHYHGKIMMLGCGLAPNTSMHAIEEEFEPIYLFDHSVEYTIIDHSGKRTTAEHISHGFNGWRQRYDRVALLSDTSWLHEFRICGATCHVIETRPFWKACREQMDENPLFFVDRF